jgi:hypothetical protein
LLRIVEQPARAISVASTAALPAARTSEDQDRSGEGAHGGAIMR